MKKLRLNRLAASCAAAVSLAAQPTWAGEDLTRLKDLPAVRVVAVISQGIGLSEEFFTESIELQLRTRGVPVTRTAAATTPILRLHFLTYELPNDGRIRGTFFYGQLELTERARLRRTQVDAEAFVWRSAAWLGARPDIDADIRAIATDLADRFATDYLVANSPSR